MGDEAGTTLRLERDGAVARLLIDRADKRNAFNIAMWQRLPELRLGGAQRPLVGRITAKHRRGQRKAQ